MGWRENFERSLSISAGWPIWLRYSLASVFALTVGLFWSQFDFGRPFLLFFPVVILCGLFLNRGSGFVATVVAALFSVFYLLPPKGSLELASPGDRVTLSIFVVVCLAIAALIEALRLRVEELRAEKQRSQGLAAERKLLIEELSHRTRNDLANIVTLLAIQANNGPADAREGFRVAAERVRTIARAHRKLEVAGQRVAVDSKEFLEGLCGDLQFLRLVDRPIALDLEIESHMISIEKAVPLGLIVNELVTNASKHAFPYNRTGRIKVEFRRQGPVYVLAVEDDGVGLPDGFEQGLGTRLISLLANQLGSQCELSRAHDSGGTRALIRVVVKTADG